MSVAGSTDLPLEIFSGYVPEIAPSDLPAGASPNAQDVQFPLGSWKTRPGLGAGVFNALAGNLTVNYQKTFVDRSQNKRYLFLDSGGSVNQEFPQGTLALGINVIPTVGSTRAKSVTAYGKEYVALSDGQFGVGDPAQWDGTFYERVSQCGPGGAPTAVDSGTVGNIPAGIHKISVFFITRSGYWTKPAPFAVWTAAGSFMVSVTNIPTGPPNVVARVLIFTEAGGSTFFFTTNASNILTDGNMVINDNVTTTATVDFSDTILASGSSVQYLFNLVELEESAGVVSYATRLFWWGGLNRVPNFNNLTFDGGFGGTPNATNTGALAAGLGSDQGGAGVAHWGSGPPPRTVTFDPIHGVSNSALLALQAIGAAIPMNAVITGIVANVTVSASVAFNCADLFVALIIGGVSLGGNKAGGGNINTVPTAVAYGTPTDTWGQPPSILTPAALNGSGFGLLYSAQTLAGAGRPSVTVSGATITIYYTVPAAAALPLGWSNGASSAGGNSALAGGFPVVWGDAYTITGDGVTATRGQINQSAYQDSLMNTILQQTTAYGVRAKVASGGGLTQGTFRVNLNSVAGAFTTSGLAVPASALTAAFQVFTGTLTTALTTIPSDLILQIYADGTPTNGGVFIIDDIEVFPLASPNLNGTIRASYAGQPESYDGLTGVLQPFFQDGGTIRNMFVLREKLYMLKDNAWYVTQDDGQNEPSAWTITVVSLAVGACGINASDLGEDWGIIANRAGPYLFWGAEPIKIGQEIESDSSFSGKPTWDSINWQFGYTIWVVLDRVRKRALIGAPIRGATSPNCIFYFDYVGLDTAQEVADHWSVKYSSYTGKILAIGNAPKWCPWSISSNSAALIERTDGTAHTFIGNGTAAPYSGGGPSNSGKIYDLLDGIYNDDGAGIPWSYATYLTPSHMEEQALQIRSHRKLYAYLSGFARGAGQMGISAQPMGNITPNVINPLRLVDPNASSAITSITRLNGIATVTCAGGHELTAGVDQQALMPNAADPSFIGTFQIQQILNAQQFTIPQYGLPDLAVGVGGAVQRLSREFEYTINVLGERVSFTFSNYGNQPGSWCQMEKIIFSILSDPWAPVRGSQY